MHRCLVVTSEAPPIAIGGIGRYVAEVVPRIRAHMSVSVLVVPTYHPATSSDGQFAVDECTAVASLGYRDALLAVDDVQRLDRVNQAGDDIAAKWLETQEARATTVIFVQDYALAPLAAALSRRLNCGVIAMCHLPVYAGFTYFDKPIRDALHQVLEARLVHGARRVIVPSTFTAEVLRLTHNTGDKVVVLPLGVSRPTQPKPFPPPPARLLAIGRPTEQKGYHFLLEMMTDLGRSSFSDTRLTIVAGASRADRLASLVARSPAASQVDLLGAVSPAELWALIDSHHLFVTGSVYETFGLAVLESMASARPAIGFELEALREVWGADLSAACGVPIARPALLAGRIKSLLANWGQLENLGWRSAQRARFFTWEQHVDVLVGIMNDIASEAQ